MDSGSEPSDDDSDDDDEECGFYPVKRKEIYHPRIRKLFRESHGIHLEIGDCRIESRWEEGFLSWCNLTIIRKPSTGEVWELHHSVWRAHGDCNFAEGNFAAGSFFRDEITKNCEFPYDHPRILAYDMTCDNALQAAYVIQTRLAAPTLHEMWPMLSEDERFDMFREIAQLLLAYDKLEVSADSIAIPGDLIASSHMPNKLNMMSTMSVTRLCDFMGPGGSCEFSVLQGTKASAMLNIVLEEIIDKARGYDLGLSEIVEDLEDRLTTDYTERDEALLLQPPVFSLKNIHISKTDIRSKINDSTQSKDQKWTITGVNGWRNFSLAPRVYSRFNIDVYCFDPSPREDGKRFEGYGRSKHCTDLDGGPDDCWYIMKDVQEGWHSNPCRHVDQRYRQRLLIELQNLDKDYVDAVLDPVKLMLARAYTCASQFNNASWRAIHELHYEWELAFNGREWKYQLDERLARLEEEKWELLEWMHEFSDL